MLNVAQFFVTIIDVLAIAATLAFWTVESLEVASFVAWRFGVRRYTSTGS